MLSTGKRLTHKAEGYIHEREESLRKNKQMKEMNNANENDLRNHCCINTKK